MKKFFVLYLIPYAEIQKMMADSKPGDMKKGMDEWNKWMEDHKDAFVERGTMLGATKRVTKDGVADVHNDLTGYSIVQAESHEVAAKMFEDQPHFMLPGASIEIMTITEMSAAA